MQAVLACWNESRTENQNENRTFLTKNKMKDEFAMIVFFCDVYQDIREKVSTLKYSFWTCFLTSQNTVQRGCSRHVFEDVGEKRKPKYNHKNVLSDPVQLQMLTDVSTNVSPRGLRRWGNSKTVVKCFRTRYKTSQRFRCTWSDCSEWDFVRQSWLVAKFVSG